MNRTVKKLAKENDVDSLRQDIEDIVIYSCNSIENYEENGVIDDAVHFSHKCSICELFFFSCM